MIKRRFYQQDYGDVSSSSSDEEEREEVEQQLEEEKEEEDDEEDEEDSDEDEGATVTTRGHEIEGSSPDDITAESSDEDDAGIGKRGPKDKIPSIKDEANREKESRPEESEEPPCGPDKSLEEDNCILQIKSVFKCRLCPRVLCLSETFLMEHLKSKKHARSKKLLKEGKLKLTLNSDGELEEEQETHAERHARMVTLAQKPSTPKKSKGRKRQAWSRKRKGQKVEREAKRKKIEQSKSEQPKSKQPKLEQPKTKQPKESSGKNNGY